MATIATSPAQEAARAVLETVPPVMRAIRGRMREGRPAAVSVPQFRALLFVRRHAGTGLSPVADHLGVSLPAASELVARLVRQGLVVREVDPASRRRIRLTLSAAGQGALDAAEVGTTEWLVGVLDRLDPASLAALVEGLHALRSVTTRDGGSGESPDTDGAA